MELDDAPLDSEWVEDLVGKLVKFDFIEPELADTARVVLYPHVIGTINPDRIASASGLNRDFVRAKAKALRDAGVWVSEPMKSGRVCIDLSQDTEVIATEILLHVLAAEGEVRHREGAWKARDRET